MPDPADREGVFTAEYPGDATLTRLKDGRIRVDQADPIIWISNELFEQADPVKFLVDGDIVKFGDVNPVAYRITERHARHVVAEKVEQP